MFDDDDLRESISPALGYEENCGEEGRGEASPEFMYDNGNDDDDDDDDDDDEEDAKEDEEKEEEEVEEEEEGDADDEAIGV